MAHDAYIIVSGMPVASRLFHGPNGAYAQNAFIHYRMQFKLSQNLNLGQSLIPYG